MGAKGAAVQKTHSHTNLHENESLLSTEDSVNLSEMEFSIYDYDLPEDVMSKYFKIQEFFSDCPWRLLKNLPVITYST